VLRGTLIIQFFVSLILLGSACGYVLLFGGNSSLLELLHRVSAEQLAAIIAVIILSVLLGAARLRALSAECGHSLSFRTALAAVAVSQAAATLFFHVYGQIVSRGVLLKHHGVPYPTTVLMTLVERTVGLLILLLVAAVGALIVFGQISIRLDEGGAELIRNVLGLTFASASALWALGRAGHLQRGIEALSKALSARAIVLVTLYTLAIQAATLVSFVMATQVLAPDVSVISLAAACTVVMLATALPISFGGWGVRELSAVVVLGAVGVGPAAALSAALLVGVLSLAVVVALGGFTTLPPAAAPVPSPVEGPDRSEASLAILAWAVALLVAVLVFFQVHVPIGKGAVNVCLADPLVMIGAGIFILRFARTEPNWKIKHLWAYAAAGFAVLVFGYGNGWLAFGSNSWAAARALGWLVLVGYAASGALIVRLTGENGREAAFLTLVAGLFGIAAFEYLRYVAFKQGIQMPFAYRVRVDGFAQNPNGFGFQVLVIAGVALTVLRSVTYRFWILVACFSMVWLTGSRSAAIAILVVTAFGLLFERRLVKVVVLAALVAALLIEFPVLGTGPVGGGTGTGAGGGASILTLVQDSRASSDRERWLTIEIAWRLFSSSPWVGQGLGYFVEHVPGLRGGQLVIHSTYLWLLAEFGLVGFAVVGASAIALFLGVWRQAQRDYGCRLAVLLLAGLATMSVAHELLFQRISYFALGLALALGRDEDAQAQGFHQNEPSAVT